MAANTARIKFKVKARVYEGRVKQKIAKWKFAQLKRIGAYARGIMQKQIRPALKGRGKKQKTITLTNILPTEISEKWKGPPPASITVFVPSDGPAIDVSTGFPVTRLLATRARMTLYARLKGRGEGKPPRQGPTNKLRPNIVFDVDARTESVVVGARPFARQPAMQGRVSVPELLNKGGVEIILGQPVKYGPRPFIETIVRPAVKRLQENIEKRPVR